MYYKCLSCGMVFEQSREDRLMCPGCFETEDLEVVEDVGNV